MRNVLTPEAKQSKRKMLDIVGIVSGILVVLIAIFAIISDNTTTQAGVSNSLVPDTAVTLTGTADGRNGPVTVKVVADDTQIYQIKVIENEETRDIGSVAVNEFPQRIYENQSLSVEAISGATITSDAIKTAVGNALLSGGLNPYNYGLIVSDVVAEKVETGVKVTVLGADDWATQYPNEYYSYQQNSENSEATDYVADYPMIATLYEGMAFSKYYSSARGHTYDITDVTETGRPHKLANCFTCKTPNFTEMVNEQGDSAYSLAFDDVLQEINEPISCYNCHANTPGVLTVTHTYLSDAMGDDFENVDAANMSCGQCHVEYYFDPETKATTLPYSDLTTMNPDDILAYYNTELLDADGQPFADYTNPRTGVRQIKVQHPDYETYLGVGSVHRGKFTCADCHMTEVTAEDGTTYMSHNLTSPLDNEDLLKNTCSECHTDLPKEVAAIQAKTEERTDEVGAKLVDLTEKLATAVESGNYTDDQLAEIRSLARDSQFYWDFVFVENSEGAHNSTLTYDCLDKAEALVDKALELYNTL